MPEVLFICTGNYYRSRFAEALFNHTAELCGSDWRAFSRGLATHLVAGHGDISLHTRFALASRNIDLRHTGARPTALTLGDLTRAHQVIALKELEHRPLMRQQFPDWEDRIQYWAVHDLDAAGPDEAIPAIEALTLRLFDSIAQTRAQPQAGPRQP